MNKSIENQWLLVSRFSWIKTTTWWTEASSVIWATKKHKKPWLVIWYRGWNPTQSLGLRIIQWETIWCRNHMWEDMWNVNFPDSNWGKRDIFTCLVKLLTCSNLISKDQFYIKRSNSRDHCTQPSSHRSFPKPRVALSHLPFSKKVPNVHHWDWFGWEKCKLWFFLN